MTTFENKMEPPACEKKSGECERAIEWEGAGVRRRRPKTAIAILPMQNSSVSLAAVCLSSIACKPRVVPPSAHDVPALQKPSCSTTPSLFKTSRSFEEMWEKTERSVSFHEFSSVLTTSDSLAKKHRIEQESVPFYLSLFACSHTTAL